MPEWFLPIVGSAFGLLVSLLLALVAYHAADISKQIQSLRGVVNVMETELADMRGQLREDRAVLNGRIDRLEDRWAQLTEQCAAWRGLHIQDKGKHP